MEQPIDTNVQSSTERGGRESSNCLKTEYYLKVISNLTTPLIIGGFTIIASIQRQNVAQSHRQKDVLVRAERRVNDTEEAQIQREQDREIARLLHRELTRFQLDDGKQTAYLQRELDLQIATNKLKQECELAEKQRSLYRAQRAHEIEIAQQNSLSNLKLEDERWKGTILVKYQRDLAKQLLFVDTNGNISHFIHMVILQMRTRSALRLLDPKRRTIVVHTLHQGGLLDVPWIKQQSPLFRVNCSGVDFGPSAGYTTSRFLLSYTNLDIEQADLQYATFHSVQLVNSPTFAFSNLEYTDWSYAELEFIEFSGKLTMNYAIFTKSNFEHVTFKKIPMNGVSFQNNVNCNECISTETPLLHALFDHADIYKSKFIHLSMADANMSKGIFIGMRFEHLNLDRADFSGANLMGAVFRNVSW
ncbi:unnamed protein product, partial [Adineta ricciae]